MFKNLLQKVELPIVSSNVCQQQLRETGKLSSSYNLHESFICAGGVEGEDTVN